MNQEDIILDAASSSLKHIGSGTGTIVGPATSSSDSNMVTIPHGMATANLIWSVTASSPDILSGKYISTPYITGDGRVALNAHVDATNLYIVATNSTAGAPQPAVTWTYIYNIILP